MKTQLFFLTILSAVAFGVYGQEPAVTIGLKVQQKSAVLGEDYSILISLPRNYDQQGNANKYPVLYLLDGSGYMAFVSEAVKILSAKNGNGVSGMPECIVVGLTTNNRERDFTPAPAKGWSPPSGPPGSDVSKITWGGADKYLEHIEKEVAQYVESNYRTQPYRIIVGHSLGGLLSYHALATKPQFFQTYIIGDPSVWWNDGATLRSVISYLKDHPAYKANMILFKPPVPRPAWFPVNIEFEDFITSSSKPQQFLWKRIELDNETHSTMVFPGVYLGLRDAFKSYRYQFHKDANVEEARQHYDSLSKAYGFPIKLSEEIFDALRGHWEFQDKDALALATCKEWLKDYPDSPKAQKALEDLSKKKGK